MHSVWSQLNRWEQFRPRPCLRLPKAAQRLESDRTGAVPQHRDSRRVFPRRGKQAACACDRTRSHRAGMTKAASLVWGFRAHDSAKRTGENDAHRRRQGNGHEPAEQRNHQSLDLNHSQDRTVWRADRSHHTDLARSLENTKAHRGSEAESANNDDELSHAEQRRLARDYRRSSRRKKRGGDDRQVETRSRVSGYRDARPHRYRHSEPHATPAFRCIHDCIRTARGNSVRARGARLRAQAFRSSETRESAGTCALGNGRARRDADTRPAA